MRPTPRRAPPARPRTASPPTVPRPLAPTERDVAASASIPCDTAIPNRDSRSDGEYLPAMVARAARLREQLALAESLRGDGRTWSDVAAALRTRYGLNARVAMRIAHGWTQAEAAQAWNNRWPDDPKT